MLGLPSRWTTGTTLPIGGDPRLAEEVTERVAARVLARAARPRGRPVEEVVNETLYDERLRLSRVPETERTRADAAFYAEIRRELPHASEARHRTLLRAVIRHYVDEIAGHFDQRVYEVATRALPVGLAGLLHGLDPAKLLEAPREALRLDDHVVLEGDVDAMCALTRRGVVLLAPTHSSNLDSPILGWAIHRLGLPPFAYGAGLNLLANPVVGLFLLYLGAYTIDRQKTDPLYRDALKEYATVAIELGQHELFFPGGTRSHSGAIETHLKKGLLGCALDAFRENLLAKKAAPRVFIVPCTLTYPLVLEASSLAHGYLESEGRERYIQPPDESDRIRRWLDFLRGITALDLRIHVRFGQALDPMGNRVTPDGTSLDPRGRPLDPGRYLLSDGVVTDDPARDAEYTRTLARRLVASYLAENVALPGHVLAAAFFELLRKRAAQPDLYRLLRSLDGDTCATLAEVEAAVDRLLGELSAIGAEGRIQLGPGVHDTTARALVPAALRALSAYHPTPPIVQRGLRLAVGDANLLFFYRNRLEGYELPSMPRLLPRGATE